MNAVPPKFHPPAAAATAPCKADALAADAASPRGVLGEQEPLPCEDPALAGDAGAGAADACLTERSAKVTKDATGVVTPEGGDEPKLLA